MGENGATPVFKIHGGLASSVASSRLSTAVGGRSSLRRALVASGSSVCSRLNVRDLARPTFDETKDGGIIGGSEGK